MCGRCRFEARDARPAKRRQDDVDAPCTAVTAVMRIKAADGSIVKAPRAAVLATCTTLNAAMVEPVQLQQLECADVLQTAFSFCQRVYNVGFREVSVRIAWQKAFLPALLENNGRGLFDLMRTARSLGATILCMHAAEAIVQRLQTLDATALRELYAPDACNDDGQQVDLCTALGGVDALADCLDRGTGVGDSEDREVLLRAAESVDERWLLAVAKVRARRRRHVDLGLDADIQVCVTLMQ